jgi:tRNA-specific 2-thiouridylase
VDLSKDQTYFLWGLKQDQLARTMFPLGDLTKAQVRELAAEFNLPTAKKHESYEICFVPNGNYAQFLEAYLKDKGMEPPAEGGAIVNIRGEEVGRHAGTHHFTVGQRKGIGIAAPEPLYVIETDTAKRTVTVGSNDALLRAALVAKDINWVSWDGLAAPARVEVRIRNRHVPAPATIYPLGP